MVKKFNATNTGKLLNKTDNDDEIKDSEDKIASITNWATTAALTAVENKIQNITTFVKKTRLWCKNIKYWGEMIPLNWL